MGHSYIVQCISLCGLGRKFLVKDGDNARDITSIFKCESDFRFVYEMLTSQQTGELCLRDMLVISVNLVTEGYRGIVWPWSHNVTSFAIITFLYAYMQSMMYSIENKFHG